MASVAENLNETVNLLDQVLEKALKQAEMNNLSPTQTKSMKALRRDLGKIKKVRFEENTAQFQQLASNFQELNQATKTRLKRLKKIIENLELAVEFATVLDDAATIAAGLAQSL